jgi:hypothetical protein
VVIEAWRAALRPWLMLLQLSVTRGLVRFYWGRLPNPLRALLYCGRIQCCSRSVTKRWRANRVGSTLTQARHLSPLLPVLNT